MGFVYQAIGPDDEPRLRDEHAYLDRLLVELIYHARSGDGRSYENTWSLFASETEQHMHYEENLLFPVYAKTGEVAKMWTDKMRAEHQVLRHEMQVLIRDLQQIGSPQHLDHLEHFAAICHAHQRRESSILYPWLASLLPVSAQWRRMQAQGIGLSL